MNELESIINLFSKNNTFQVLPAQYEPTIAIETIQEFAKNFWTAKQIFTAEEIENRFEVPSDFVAYLQKIESIKGWQGKANPNQYPWKALYNYAELLLTTKYDYETFLYEKKGGYLEEHQQHPMMLLSIGFLSDNHYFHLSCDKAHHFGKVFEAHDAELYQLPDWASDKWNTFTTFLKKEFLK